ncbi:MAG: molybdenum cofactor biosynthesis protein MoaE [Methanophagales archaeon]|nr:molybdenum cofactor biosynthesis protein MoaE [Methanophagales archaeon]
MITESDITITIEEFVEEVRRERSGDIGAIVTFLGVVRGGAGIKGMEVEVRDEDELERLKRDVLARFEIEAVKVVHRKGRLRVGEGIVLVLVASKHRKDAFIACEYMVDKLKVGTYIKEREIS